MINIGEYIKKFGLQENYMGLKFTEINDDQFTIDEMMKLVETIGKSYISDFCIDAKNYSLYEQLIYWVFRNGNFTCIHPEEGRDIKGRVNKGLFIAGNTGSGKTMAVRILAQLYRLNPVKDASGINLSWNPISAIKLCEIYRENKNYDELVKLPIVLIDDIGSEPNEINYMGNKINVLANFIERRADDPTKVTSFTSNIPLNHPDFKARYGDRVYSRVVNMCNYLTLTGDDRRKIITK